MRKLLTRNTWTEITDQVRVIQNLGDYFIYIVTGAKPTTLTGIKLVPAGFLNVYPLTGEKVYGLCVENNIEVELFSADIQIGAVELKDDDTDNRANIKPANTARTTATKVLAVQHVDAEGKVLTQSTQDAIKTALDGISTLLTAIRISSVPTPVAVTETAQNITLVKAEIKNTGSNIIYIRESASTPTPADANDYPLYAGEVMGLLTGIHSVVCGAGLTSTLNILELV